MFVFHSRKAKKSWILLLLWFVFRQFSKRCILFFRFIYGNRHIEYSNECWIIEWDENRVHNEVVTFTNQCKLCGNSSSLLIIVACSIQKTIVLFFPAMQQNNQLKLGYVDDDKLTAYIKLLFIKICERGKRSEHNLWWKSMPRFGSVFDLRT